MSLGCRAVRFMSIAAALVFSFALSAQAGQIVLDFTDIPIPGGTDSAPFFTYTSHGYSLTATNPPTGFLSGFEAHDVNSIFYMGKIGVGAFAPASPPDNVIQLTHDNGDPFSLISIDLARLFPFDPAPTVTFTGTFVGGGTITESFTVTTASGVRAFQTFDFAGFTNLTSVTWGQPVLAEGLHQFTNIVLQSPVVPEPSALILMTLGMPLAFSVKLLAGRIAVSRES